MTREFLIHSVGASDDSLVEAIGAREVEIGNYELSIAIYEEVLARTDITEAYRQETQSRLAATQRELAKSETIYEALLNRKPSQERWDAAVARYQAKKASA